MAFKLQRRAFLQLAMGTAATFGASAPFARALAAATTPRPSDGRTTCPSWDPNQRFTPDAQPIFKAVFDQPLDQDPQLKLIPHLIKSWTLAPDGSEHGGRAARRRHVPQRRQDDDGGFPLHVPRTHQVRPQARHREFHGARCEDIVIESPTKATMKFNSPAPTVPQWMAFLGSYIVPKKYIESQGPR